MTKAPVNLVSATQTGIYRLRLVFDDNHVQEIDFQPFLDHSKHPDIRAYLEPARFSGFSLVYGELVWGDYELCFPMMDLYRATIDHSVMLAEVA